MQSVWVFLEQLNPEGLVTGACSNRYRPLPISSGSPQGQNCWLKKGVHKSENAVKTGAFNDSFLSNICLEKEFLLRDFQSSSMDSNRFQTRGYNWLHPGDMNKPQFIMNTPDHTIYME